jgi:hypothetical protein
MADEHDDRNYYDKLLDFTGFDFEKWKTDPDKTRPKQFEIQQSRWDPAPIALVTRYNERISQSLDLTPAEMVDLYDKLGAFIEEHHLRDHT